MRSLPKSQVVGLWAGMEIGQMPKLGFVTKWGIL